MRDIPVSPVRTGLGWLSDHWYNLRTIVADLGLVTTSTVVGISQDFTQFIQTPLGIGFLGFAGLALVDSAARIREIPSMNKLKEAQDRLEMAHIEYSKLFRLQLYSMAQRLGLSHTERISVYEYSAQYNVCRFRARYSSHTEYTRQGRYDIPAGEGCIGKALNYGECVLQGLPDKAKHPLTYLKEQNKLAISKETLQFLNMPTRSYAAYAINNQAGIDKVGVVVFESTEEYFSIDEANLKKALADEERHIRLFLEFMGKLDPISAPIAPTAQPTASTGTDMIDPALDTQSDSARLSQESQLALQIFERHEQATKALFEKDRELTDITLTRWNATNPSEEINYPGFMILPPRPPKITTVELWNFGFLYRGKKLLLRTPHGVHPAEAWDEEQVQYKGTCLSYVEFGKLATEWTTINIYSHIRTNYHGVERTLEELRTVLEDELARSKTLAVSIQEGNMVIPQGILPGVSALLAWNRLAVGEKLCFSSNDQQHVSEILPHGRVRHNGQELKLSEWCARYQPPSAVSYYVRLYVVRERRNHYLDQLMRVWHSNYSG
jgi:hypothetical protein